MRRRARDAPRKGDLREKAILDAAEALLEREAAEPLTMDAIAEGAGVTRGALYFYFGSKQDVLVALVALVARTVAVLPRDAEGPDASLEGVITDLMSRTERMWREHGKVMRAAVDFSSTVPRVRELWSGTVDVYAAAIARMLSRAGVPDGTAPDGASLAHALAWMTERNFYWASACPEAAERLRAVGETCVEIWIGALRSSLERHSHAPAATDS